MRRFISGFGFLFLFILFYTPQAYAATSTYYDFNTSDQLSTFFYNDGGSTVAWNATSGISGTGAVNVGATSTNEVFVTKQGYVNGGEGSVYTFTSYIKSIYNGGYSGLGFTNDPNAVHLRYATPATTLGISVHGGGFFFHNNAADSSGSWDSGGVVNSTISDLLNNGSPDDWYKVVFI
ncbi:MAG: hypothetical protein KAT06_13155, partial [Gammaproteobacteria bacterium]|nr:hypothetical protein [Gammaproteobacteria bacterium]